MFLFTVLTESGGAKKRFFCDIGTFFFSVFFDLSDRGTRKDIRKKKKSSAQYCNALDHDLWVIIKGFNC